MPDNDNDLDSILTYPVSTRFLPSEKKELDKLVEYMRREYPGQRYSQSDVIRYAVYALYQAKFVKKESK
jgi:hypothetical protein